MYALYFIINVKKVSYFHYFLQKLKKNQNF